MAMTFSNYSYHKLETSSVPGFVCSSKSPFSRHSAEKVRLPESITPIHYELKLNVNMPKEFSFSGLNKILVNVNEPTREVFFHSVDLNIHKVYIENTEGEKFEAIKFDPIDTEMIKATFSKELVPHLYTLFIEFSGIITDQLRGFYKSSYEFNGKTYWLASTHFEPMAARRAFPCFDEPLFKATFQLQITCSKEFVALSNTQPLETIEVDEEFKTVKYEITPKMSTYLVTYVIGPLESVTAMSGSKKISVWTRIGDSHRANYALNCAKGILKYYEELFGIEFPLSKVDLVAISSFAMGAMENWGLITFRDTALLYDEKESSEANKQRVAVVVAHELAHQWFGNLVTMKWWNDLWLNEGFASFMEYFGVNSVEPDWQMFDQMLVDAGYGAFSIDASSYSHPIAGNVTLLEEIETLFDLVSYNKGAMMIKMLQTWVDSISPGYFFKRIRYHLSKYKYSNADTNDLMNSIQTDLINVDIESFMESWDRLTGYPIVKIKEDGGKTILSQSKYLNFPFNKNLKERLANELGIDLPVANNAIWPIPLTGITKDGKLFTLYFDQQEMVFNNTIAKLNVGQMGFYRVLYPMKTLKALKINFHQLSTGDRAGIIHDVLAFALSGQLHFKTAMDFLTVLKYEREYVVWKLALSKLSEFTQILDSTAHIERFRGFIKDLMQPSINEYLTRVLQGDDRFTHLEELFVSMMFESGVIHGNQVRHFHLPHLLSLFENLRAGRVTIDEIPNHSKGAVYITGALFGDDQSYDYILEEYLKSNFAVQQQRLLTALSYAPQEYRKLQTLKLSISDKVRTQDSEILMAQVGAHSFTGRVLAWELLEQNHEYIYKTIASSGFDRFIKNVCAKFVSKKHLDEIFLFFKHHPLPPSNRAIAQAVESVDGAEKWLKENEKMLEKFNSQ
ncbi:Peptidase M1, membrane alanine aminopeptidase domain-containing protein [Rozella allomycis CSF55]|uniref:Aminopeptidase n=1 Tax=Rozella allomycis (strain CSF55) TaxID=988480 RepID=A0A075AW31_ROZAC|nr:Peptidase M1, membrane alanine aminopeptidase domain-containing protein [Rozella allomycis CSF55]|eukprot:EPZ32917.1 Peptidase M1, membrane alanine aminopeptidase domain-containing protein [Rozella allomycis CSF55]